MIAYLTNREIYVLNGDEDALLSIVPCATGVYSRVLFNDFKADITKDAKKFAQIYMFQAIRDLQDEDSLERRAHLDACKELYFKGVNYLNLVGGFGDPDEVLLFYSKVASSFLMIQAEAKITWDEPNRIYMVYNGIRYLW